MDFKSFAASIKDEDTTMLEDGLSAAEFSECIDTGSYALNALFSGSMYQGIQDNKITGFGGPSATGKTFFMLGVVKEFLDKYPDAGVLYFDTEAAVTKKMMSDRKIDTSRVMIAEVDTIQKFKQKVLNVLEKYKEIPTEKRTRLMIVLDSLGMLSTTKEMEDSLAGSDKKDMTQQAQIKSTFRTITLKLARLQIPMLLSQHTYSVIGSYVPMQELAGGTGVKYAASTIALLSKSKERDGTDVIGNIITVTMYKARLSKENKKVKVLVTYDKGLDRYFGLLPLAEKAEIAKKVGKKYVFINGVDGMEGSILKNPEKYYTPDVMDALEKFCNKEFTYGSLDDVDEETIDEVLSESDEKTSKRKKKTELE